ncbi:MAG TPA: uroporphyrinogen decarboxylase family protein [Candidatus Methylomirabilis sp.]|nr:uroporphyrinogen decarboxylase family protein [Candidatus Methylomirabilis sp.]
MEPMTKRERVQAALSGQPVDRIPISFWRHFPDLDLDPMALAEALVAFHRRYDLDFIKVMPNGVYGVEDWGCEIAYQGGTSGARTCVRHAVQRIGDWERLRPLKPTAGALGRELGCLRAVCAGRGDDAPVLQTIFSPFTLARKVAGPDLVGETMLRDPDRLHAALGVISLTVETYVGACLDAGADGIFFASQTATPEVMTPEEHDRFVEPYDLRVLAAARRRGAIVLLHLHGDRPYLISLAARYPVQALNWHDRRTSPSLAEAATQVSQCLVGGLDERGAMITATPQEVRAQVQDAVAQCRGRRLIVGSGCVVDLQVPEANLKAAREAVEGL